MDLPVRDHGVQFTNTDYATLDGVTCQKANKNGVHVLGSGGSFVTVQNCTLKWNWSGVFSDEASNTTVDGCIIFDNVTDGAHANDAPNMTVKNCEIYLNAQLQASTVGVISESAGFYGWDYD
jgi:hypothetical protein